MVLVGEFEGAEGETGSIKTVLRGGRSVEAAFDLVLKGAAVLDGGCSPILDVAVLVVLPDVLAADERVAGSG